MESSPQPEARKWEGSLHNNLGYALHSAGQFEEALAAFEHALAACEREGNAAKIRIAWWMIAWTYLRAWGDWRKRSRFNCGLRENAKRLENRILYVFEELEALYRALGDVEKADGYRKKQNG